MAGYCSDMRNVTGATEGSASSSHRRRKSLFILSCTCFLPPKLLPDFSRYLPASLLLQIWTCMLWVATTLMYTWVMDHLLAPSDFASYVLQFRRLQLGSLLLALVQSVVAEVGKSPKIDTWLPVFTPSVKVEVTLLKGEGVDLAKNSKAVHHNFVTSMRRMLEPL